MTRGGGGKGEGGGLPGRSYWANLTGSAASKLRSSSPNLTAVKGAFAVSYRYACRAFAAITGVINVPIEASQISSLAPDPESREVIRQALAGAGVSAADEALKAISSFVPGGHPLYRVTKAVATGFSKIYSKKGSEGVDKKDGASAEELTGYWTQDNIEKKLQEMSSEINELKMQNQMLREKVSGLSGAEQPPLQSSSPSQSPLKRQEDGCCSVVDCKRLSKL